MPTGTNLMSRAAAATVLLMVPVLLLALAIAPHAYSAFLQSEIEEHRARIDGLARTAARQANALPDQRSGSLDDGVTGPAIVAATGGIAAARLQNDLATVVRQTGGEVRLMQVVPQTSAAATQRVTVRLDAAIDNNGLRDLLLDIETRMPMLFVDELVVRKPEAGSTQLAVEIKVSAFFDAGDQPQ